jgi:hypothetical protein
MDTHSTFYCCVVATTTHTSPELLKRCILAIDSPFI